MLEAPPIDIALLSTVTANEYGSFLYVLGEGLTMCPGFSTVSAASPTLQWVRLDHAPQRSRGFFICVLCVCVFIATWCLHSIPGDVLGSLVIFELFFPGVLMACLWTTKSVRGIPHCQGFLGKGFATL